MLCATAEITYCLVIVVCSLALTSGYNKVVDYDYDYDDDDDMEAENPIHTGKLAQDTEHLGEHIDEAVKFDPKTATAEEITFHFFNIHDKDNDDKLDGLELYHSIDHGLDAAYNRIASDNGLQPDAKAHRYDKIRKGIIRTVDRILSDDDVDKDGYLSYAEYANAGKTAKYALEKRDML